MHNQIKKVAVIGSGVMGSQIAAHITNAGIPVLLLDIVPKEGSVRNALTFAAVARLSATEPSPFMDRRNVHLITCGNLEDDLDRLIEVDWIIEAVTENPQIKSDLYKKIDAVRKPGSIVSSNTSTIPLAVLTQGQRPQFAKDFLVTHFFNPPRFMRLLEFVTGPQTDPAKAAIIRAFCDIKLGKGVVDCKDSPGFIANRLGIFFLQAAIKAAFEQGITVEEADAVFSKPSGMPKTGVFGLADLIGLDLLPLIAKSFVATLPETDAYRRIDVPQPLVDKMIADGYTGRKGKGGFYRLVKGEKGKVKEVIDLQTGVYGPLQEPKPKALEEAGKNLRALCESTDKIGRYAWTALSEVLAYAASLIPQIADDVVAVDSAMRWGFNWKYGPFELIDQLGVDWFADRLRAEGRPVPSFLEKARGHSYYRVSDGRLEYFTLDGTYTPIRRPEGVILLADIRRAQQPVLKNDFACVWDIGDGIWCFEFYCKMNTLNPETFVLLRETIDRISAGERGAKALVIYNEGDLFSAGANLNIMRKSFDTKDFSIFDGFIADGQHTFLKLRFAPFPTVAAPAGLAYGGGVEITLHTNATQAHAELSMGLVEANIGIIPSWGGTTQMLRRAYSDPKCGSIIDAINKVYETLRHASVSKSAFHARELGYMRNSDGITMNRDRLLYDAKQKAMELAKDYQPQRRILLPLPGAAYSLFFSWVIEVAHKLGKYTLHDTIVGKALMSVMCGDRHWVFSLQDEEQLIEAERILVGELIRTKATQERIAYTLKTGKHLKN